MSMKLELASHRALAFSRVQAAGLAPQAAVFGAVWGGKDAAGAVTEWQRELTASAAVSGGGPVLITPPTA